MRRSKVEDKPGMKSILEGRKYVLNPIMVVRLLGKCAISERFFKTACMLC